MASSRPFVSVVIPCRNEEDNVREITAAVNAQLEPLDVDWEIILIDNESTDRTVELARALCEADKRIKLIVNTRNFGQLRSPVHAIFAGRGDVVIGLCADFQDPPELLPQFIARWRAGVPIVLGARESEKTLWWKAILGRLYYNFVSRFADVPAIPNATGFGLYDRKVVDLIRSLNEPEPFYRSLLVETGYEIEVIKYGRPERRAGRSNNNFFNLVNFALSGLTNSSRLLLRSPFFIGIISILVSGLFCFVAVLSLMLGQSAGLIGLAALVQFNFGMLFLFLGLIGDQIRLISERQRKMPLVVERERINFDD
jgi:glycosyltransferase involved in cell wall biosynthesis